jgi:hypothetical protein
MQTIPVTYARSTADANMAELALAAAIDAVFRDAIALDVAAGIANPTRQPIQLPDIDTLIYQAGIATGPCLPDPRTPSPAARHAKAGASLVGRATWWLIKGGIYVTAVVVRELTSVVLELLVGKPTPQPELEPAPAQQPPRPVRPSDFLLKTSDHLRDRGWTQFRLESSRGLCVIGAERSLIGDGVGSHEIAQRANTHLLAVVRGWSVPSWNDRLSRREDQVHEALRAAAARARAAGE